MTNKPNKASARTRAPQDSDTVLKNGIVALIPFLRAFSRSLCVNRALADDMAQTALAKAWAARGSFETGTNLKAWLFTILRNEITTHHRRAWRQSVWDEDAAERIPAPSDQQEWSAELSDVACAMQRLPIVQREALVLVGAGGVTYQDAATICGVELGTMKSRVARARTALLEILDSDQKKPVMQRPQAGGAMKDILAQLSALTQRGPSIGAHV